ncbi:MAG TPA: flagellar assembly protein T N-terminal domain-containing protein [Phycisphaerae bacterium]|nr:flagellar assembly protein T N-terminal domain-containing protein [Phycisphaerae bacterium]
MRRCRFHFFLSMSLLVSAPTPLFADDVKIITATGQAAGSDLNAMEQAKQDALRKAVEQACGTFISSHSKTKSYEAVYDKVLSLAPGFVSEYEVLERKIEDGISHCKVRAHVSTVAFEKEWALMLHTLEIEGNPRCVVVVVEDNNTDDTTPPRTDGVAQSVLEQFFLDKNVQLMDQDASDKSKARDMDLAARNNEIEKLAAMAASFKADVVIRGAADAKMVGVSEISGRPLFKWSATLTIRAYHTDSAQMLMSAVYSETKASVNENQGGDDAIRACAEKYAGKILGDIGEAWRKRQNVRRTIQVTLENCSRRDFKEFESALSAERGVQAVRMRELVNNVCQTEVDWEYDLERLAARIESIEIDGATLEIVQQTHDRITARLGNRAPSSRPDESDGD